MKNILLSILILSVIGCTTVTKPDGSVTKTVDPAVLRLVAQEASAVGGTVWLQSHQADRPAFLLARTSLRALIASGTGSTSDLQKALAALPIAQLQGSSGAVIVSGAVVLIDTAGRQLQTADKKQVFTTYILPVAQGIEAGLTQALGEP